MNGCGFLTVCMIKEGRVSIINYKPNLNRENGFAVLFLYKRRLSYFTRKRFGEADTDDSYSSNRYRFKLHINSIVLQMRLDKQSVLLYNKSNVGLSNIIK